MSLKRFDIAWVVSLVMLILIGCAKEPPPAAEIDGLYDVGIWYSRFAAAHNGVGPANADELKKYITAQDKTADTAAMFTSGRDGEPLVVVPKQQPTAFREDQLPTVMAFEHSGYDGKRYVVSGGPTVEEMDNEHLAELLPPGVTLP